MEIFDILKQIAMFVGAARLIIMPIMVVIVEQVKNTPWKWDDDLVEKIETSSIWRTFVFLVDWIISINVPAALRFKNKTLGKVSSKADKCD
jgi:hypothetical protein